MGTNVRFPIEATLGSAFGLPGQFATGSTVRILLGMPIGSLIDIPMPFPIRNAVGPSIKTM